jgi:E3 ubiquitin-protein ligase RNF217
MADNMPEEINDYQDVKQWQHCSLFNLDLFNDEHDHHINLSKDIIHNTNIDNCTCSLIVLQKNYNTQLEHVAEKLLSPENKALSGCSYCAIHDTKGQSLNRKILLGSTAILDNFLRNNLKTPLFTNCNSSPLSTTVTNLNPTSRIIAGSSNQRRWHSERTSRQQNVRANLPLTIAQRQVLERYMNHPFIKPPTHRSHHRRQPITGKAIENTGTALSAFLEQPLHPRKNSAPPINPHPISINRQCFLADTVVHNQSKPDDDDDDDDDNESISSDVESSSDEDTPELNPSSIVPNSSEILSECIICCELKRLQKRTCCDFSACSTCLNIYVEEQIKQGIIRIQCPNEHCHIYMHRDEIHKRCLTPELRQKLTQFFIDNNRSINIKTCPRCSNIHEIDLEVCQSMRRAPTKVQCVECNLIWCFQCHSPWHDGIQCKEFRRGDRMLKKWAREVHYGQHNAQQCPSCKVNQKIFIDSFVRFFLSKVYIQRTKGCDHIVCLRCKTEFCYKCGDRFRDIKFIGLLLFISMIRKNNICLIFQAIIIVN